MNMKARAQRTYEDEACLGQLDRLARDIAHWSREKGFWNSSFDMTRLTPDQVMELTGLRKSQKLMLIVSEAGEQLEAIRKPAESDKMPGVIGEHEEVADLLIRLLDYCGYYNIPIGRLVGVKMAVNEGRPYMHGKAF